MYRSQQTGDVSATPKADEAKAAGKPTDVTSGDSKPAESKTVASSLADPQESTTASTASAAVAKPAGEAEPMSTFAMMLMWVPFVVAMSLWLYLRGRNQAAERARAEALTVASKKQKKASRSQSASVGSDDSAGSIVQDGSSRSKGNSKKNKKDKLRRKQSAAMPSIKNVNQVAMIAKATSDVAGTVSDVSAAGKSAVARDSARASSNVSQTAATQMPADYKSAEQKPSAAAAQVNKAIFEPLRKVNVKVAPPASETSDEASEGDERDDYQFRDRRPSRQRRSNEPTIITTPTKISGTRFEKLNVPAANAGLSSATNRWPSEASRPVAAPPAAQAVRPFKESRATSSISTPSTVSPQIARGLSAFVKKATNAGDTAESTDANPPTEVPGN